MDWRVNPNLTWQPKLPTLDDGEIFSIVLCKQMYKEHNKGIKLLGMYVNFD
jgi:hypothetical protein